MKKQMSILCLAALMLAGCGTSSSTSVSTTRVSIVLENEYGVTSTTTYSVDDETTIYTLLQQEYDMTLVTSEDDTIISSLDFLSPKVGAEIHLYHDGNLVSNPGLLRLTNDSIYTLKVEWVDSLQQAVDHQIQSFLANHISSFLNQEEPNYMVLAAAAKLGLATSYINPETYALQFDTLDSSLTLGNLFKLLVNAHSLGLSPAGIDATLTHTILEQSSAIGNYATDKTLLNVLLYDDPTLDSLIPTAITNLTTLQTPKSMDFDYGASILLALSPFYETHASVRQVVNEYVDYLVSEQLPNGSIVEHFDWSSENVATLANVIIGLVSLGLDPSGSEFKKGENSLVSALLSYGLDDGSFRYMIDGDADLLFSTAQAFAALVVYQQFINRGLAIHLYLD